MAAIFSVQTYNSPGNIFSQVHFSLVLTWKKKMEGSIEGIFFIEDILSQTFGHILPSAWNFLFTPIHLDNISLPSVLNLVGHLLWTKTASSIL